MIVNIERMCNCTNKLELPKQSHFETKEEAIKKAQTMIDLLKEKSCHTHNFKMTENEKTIEITSQLNSDNFI